MQIVQMEGAGRGVGGGGKMADQKELDLRSAERAHDRSHELGDMFSASSDSHALAAIKILLVMNGGAAVALFAFAGGLSTKFSPAQLEPLIRTLMWFVWGVVFSGVAEMFAYLCQLCYSANLRFVDRNWKHPYVHRTKKSKLWYATGVAFHLIAFAAAIISLGKFIFGMYRVQRAVLAII